MDSLRRKTRISAVAGVEMGYFQLQRNLLHICLINFFLLAMVGLLLRAYPIFSFGVFYFKNVLHAHSHFAFGGWIMPALLALALKFFPELCTESAYPHWRRIIVMVLCSAYGMLLSFPFQGYGVVSIIFSTLSIASGFYAGYMIRNIIRRNVFSASESFLRAGFLYFVISAAGPFATGPLIAMGKAGSEIYYNAIYFYLHFQYNGFFTFIVWAVLYRFIERRKSFNNGKFVFQLMNFACVPAYALSILWTRPTIIINIIGGIAAVLQLLAIVLLLKDLKGISWKKEAVGWIFRLAIFAFITKSILQLLSAIPAMAQLAFQNRNFIIAYLHMVLIGFVSLFIFSLLPKLIHLPQRRWFNYGIVFFVLAFFSTELLLVLQAAGLLLWLPGLVYSKLIFSFSILFPLGLVMIFISGQRQYWFVGLGRISP